MCLKPQKRCCTFTNLESEDNKEPKVREQELPRDYYIAMYRSYGAVTTSESPNKWAT